jgi:hypothetical protein
MLLLPAYKLRAKGLAARFFAHDPAKKPNLAASQTPSVDLCYTAWRTCSTGFRNAFVNLCVNKPLHKKEQHHSLVDV